jgi:hypothetical protein
MFITFFTTIKKRVQIKMGKLLEEMKLEKETGVGK